VLLRLAYLGLINTFAMLRLLPKRDRDKDIEILALRHQIGLLQRQLGDTRVRFTPIDRAVLAALLHRVPTPNLAPAPSARAPRHDHALASRPARTTPRYPDRNVPADRARSGSWSCAWPRRTPAGAPAESTAVPRGRYAAAQDLVAVAAPRLAVDPDYTAAVALGRKQTRGVGAGLGREPNVHTGSGASIFCPHDVGRPPQVTTIDEHVHAGQRGSGG
jgi:hypothetical protein